MTIHLISRAMLPYAPMGGLERATRSDMEILKALGEDVVAYTPTGAASHVEDGIVDVAWPPWGRSVAFAVSYRWWTRRTADSVSSRLQDGDVVVAHGAASALASELRRAARIVVIHNPHGMEEFEHDGGFQTELQRRLLRRMSLSGARAADVVVATDAVLVDRVVANLKVPRSRVAIVCNGVDTHALRNHAGSGSGLSKDAGSFRLVTIGRLVGNKGYDLLAAALSELDGEGWLQGRWEWIHFGEGPLSGALTAEARCHGWESRLRLIRGASDDAVQSTLSTADAFVQPSRYEGSSLTTLEAMAHAVPVLATAVGGLTDKVIDGVTGLLCDQPAARSLAQGLRRIADMPTESRAAMGRRGRDEVQLRFSNEARANALMDIIQRLRASN